MFYNYFLYYCRYIFKFSAHLRLSISLKTLTKIVFQSFLTFRNMQEDTIILRYIDVCMCSVCECIGKSENMNFLSLAVVTLYEVYVWREKDEWTFPLGFFSWLSTLVRCMQATDTCAATGQQEKEAVNLMSYLQKTRRKSGAYPPYLKPN